MIEAVIKRSKTLKMTRNGLFAAVAVLLVAFNPPSAHAFNVDARPGHENDLLAANTLLGSYLAGRIAQGARDNDAAAKFYGQALARDPENSSILRQSFLLEVTRGDWDKAFKLAEAVLKVEKKQRVALLVLGIRDFKQGRFESALKNLNDNGASPISQLTTVLGRAWVMQGQGKTDEAFKTLEKLSNASWAVFYQRYHQALIADVARRRKTADNSFSQIFSKDPRTLRVALAYARHMFVRGKKKTAKNIIESHLSRTIEHPLSKALQADINNGKVDGLMVRSADEGLAEVFYGVGDALVGEGGIDVGTIYLQMALYLKPDFPLALMALAEVFEDTKRYKLANEYYDKISEKSPLWLTVMTRRAFNFNSLEKVDEAKLLLDELVAKRPKALRPLEAAGNILRARKRYSEARDYYAKAISQLDKPTRNDWKYFYSRGVCYERMKDWPSAEKDLLAAHKLHPDQPLVLNYLGYSWVDQGLHLKRAMELIRKAVRLKPEDGYFIDSLGWAHYRLGKYKDAVRELERAVEIKSDDSVINDHLGDAYWRVGRRTEARFQWTQALDLKPEKGEIPKINKKLKDGLPAEHKDRVAAVSSGTGQLGAAVKKVVGAGNSDGTTSSGKNKKKTLDDKSPDVKKRTRKLKGADPVKSTAGGEQGQTHLVKSGETLWIISKKYLGKGSLFRKIEKINNLRSNSTLRPGQNLIIPLR